MNPQAPDPAGASTPLVIRPIRPDDAPQLQAAFEHWSLASRYNRFHTGLQRLPESLLHYLTHVDGVDHVALVALNEHGPAPVGLGVGRFVRLKSAPDTAELALAVADEAQGHGIARQLLIALAAAAAERGIRTFCMDVLESNDHVCQLLDSLGAREHGRDAGAIHFELPVAMVQRAAAKLNELDELDHKARRPGR